MAYGWCGGSVSIFSVAVAVGFIALAGVAAETGVVMLIYLDHAVRELKDKCAVEGRPFTRSDLHEAIMVGADDDGRRHHRRALADHVQCRHGLRSDAAHRGADDRRNAVVDSPHIDCHSSRLRSD